MDMKKIAQRILSAKEVAIVAHTSPDGDAVGSVMALYLGLQSLGKTAHLVSKDEVPDFLSFLPLTQAFNEADGDVPASVDLIIALDCGNFDRLSLHGETVGRRPLVVIDHHSSNDKYGELNHVDIKASATGELVYDLLQALSVTIDLPMATCLYTAITTDCGSFRYESTTPKTLAIAADLMAKGVDFPNIARRVFDEKPLPRVKLLGMALNSLESYFDGRVNVMCLSETAFDQLGMVEKDTGDIVNYGLAPQEALVSLILKEQDDKIRVSIRTKSKVHAGDFASHFSGGGHARAAGCTLMTPSFKEAKDHLLRELEAYLY